MTAKAPEINIEKLPARKVRVPVVGTTPLIMHKFSEKARKQMLDAAQGKKKIKMPKDPKAEYEAAIYRTKKGKPAMPSIAFKSAIVGAARFYGKDIRMTELRQFIFVAGEIGEDGRALTEIKGRPRMREDVARVGNGGTDLRYRPEFVDWRADLEIIYVGNVISLDSVLALIDAAGVGVGIGDWRPERKGDFGTFRIDDTKKIEVV